MPSLFGRHLLDKVVFLTLDQVAADLPPLTEEVLARDGSNWRKLCVRGKELTTAVRE